MAPAGSWPRWPRPRPSRCRRSRRCRRRPGWAPRARVRRARPPAAPTPRGTGSDSPVSAALSTLRSIGLQHPGVGRDPVALAESTMSPGTSSAAGTRQLAALAQDRSLPRGAGRKRPDGPLGPVLLDEAERAVDDHHRDDRASRAGACRRRRPAPAATQSISAKKWSSWAANWRGRPGPRACGSRFGPACSSRAAASSCDRPPASTPSSPRTAAGGSVASRGSDTSPRIAAGTAGPGARQPRCPLLRLVVVAAVVFIALTVTRGAAGRQGRGSRRIGSIGPCPVAGLVCDAGPNRGGSRCVGPSA